MFLTIFTPTFNRAYTLERLYYSLCRQTCKDFEWLIIDDGSTDHTDFLAQKWKEDRILNIKYIRKMNGGKASAYNLALEFIRGKMFTCVDSDDYLTDNAVERVKCLWEEDELKMPKKKAIIGQVFFRKALGGGIPITTYKGKEDYSTLLDFYRQHGLQGDTMLVYRSDIVKKYSFPVFAGEKFIPESYLYDQYDNEGVLHIYRESLYVGEYLQDGYTASMKKVNHDSPRGYETYILQRLRKDKYDKYLIQDLIKYIAIKHIIRDGRLISDSPHKLLTMLLIVPGRYFYRKAYYEFDKASS